MLVGGGFAGYTHLLMLHQLSKSLTIHIRRKQLSKERVIACKEVDCLCFDEVTYWWKMPRLGLCVVGELSQGTMYTEKSTLQRPSAYIGVVVYVISCWNSVCGRRYQGSSGADVMVVSYFQAFFRSKALSQRVTSKIPQSLAVAIEAATGYKSYNQYINIFSYVS